MLDNVSLDKMREGFRCQCCGQNVKLWKRSIYRSLALFLAGLYRLYRADRVEFHSTARILAEVNALTGGKYVRATDYATLKHWGLIDQPTADLVSGKRNPGKWRLTFFGLEFVEGRRSVPSFIEIFNDRVYAESADKIYYKDALEGALNYNELTAKPILPKESLRDPNQMIMELS